MALASPYRLLPIALEKVWGSTQLEPWFPNSDTKMGEFWFTEPGSPLLIKFLFTTENLSIQVHPNDEQAARLEPGCRGKTEMWHILKAEPGAKLAMGLKSNLTPGELRSACEDGGIMEELRWVPAIPSETWFIPAGTIHAIGAGITVAEIQQNSDITYRLYDYGRQRELHLEKGISVSDVRSRPEPVGDRIESPYFSTQITKIDHLQRFGPGYLIITSGKGELSGREIHQGEVWHLPTESCILPSSPLHAILTVGTIYDPHNHQSGK
jgi:mannose-6-phosphate isomerase